MKELENIIPIIFGFSLPLGKKEKEFSQTDFFKFPFKELQ